MKILLCILVLGICYDAVESYVTGSSPIGRTDWLKSKSAINDSSSSSYQPSSVHSPTQVAVDDIFREEYDEWASRHGKSTADTRRFETFKRNFMLQMQHNKKTGIFKLLNEFGDMTEKEFELGEYETENNDGNFKSTDNSVEAELVNNFVPRVRMLDSQTIPRVSNFESAYGRPRQLVHGNHRDQRHLQQRQRQQAPAGYEPKVHAIQYPAIGEPYPPPKRRRVVRMQELGPDKVM
mmetsp:Transcript_14278/g.29825  ORF Transcript_14278/g.29825 Transcript_14278/m.29825 type:complete len:236 (+) Transcript_14278:156-863(+)